MSILINKETKLVIQGITGRDGKFHCHLMQAYGTQIVAGTSPGKGGQLVNNIPVFDTVLQAVESTGANTSIIFVPAQFAKDAILEAGEAGIKLIIAITEGIPTLDMIYITKYVQQKGILIIGPNCPGLISPGKSLCGILPASIFKEGHVGVISRSGTLTYEIVHYLTYSNFGQSTCIGIGGDPIAGLYFKDLLKMFENDDQTEAIVLVGEIGGNAEEEAAAYIAKHITKPVVAYITGQSAPADKKMGHAGAIISSGSGTAQDKIKAFKKYGIAVALTPDEVATLLKIEYQC